MKCPYCASDDIQVKDSRPAEDGTAIRRRRICNDCGGRFTTFERVQLREITIVKSDGRREAFNRDKLVRSMQLALRKRGIDDEQLQRIANSIQRAIETTGEKECDAKQLGEMVIEALRKVDGIAYIRFASVYRDFREAQDFEAILDEVKPETQ
ncbi:MAG: transcriptional regulator NrdR [Pseudomonadota bacterium]